MNRPHDLLFKEAISRKTVAASFIQNYLNERDKAAIDLETLESVKDSHITTDLIEFFSDAVYSALNHNRTKRTYILFEHKSYIDHGTGSQLLENIAMILQYHRRQYGRSAKTPRILTVVINQTDSDWIMGEDYSLSMNPLSSQPVFPDLSFAVFNLSRIPDQCITGVPYLRILFLTLKHIHHPQLPKKLGEIAVLFRELGDAPEAKGYLKAFLLYIMAAAPKSMVPEIMETIRGVVMNMFDEETNKVLEEVLRELFKEELDSAQRDNERKIQEYEQKLQEYELRIQEYEQRFRKYEQKIQQLEQKIRQLEQNAINYEQSITRNMISQGMDNQTIRNITGLEYGAIEEIRRKAEM